MLLCFILSRFLLPVVNIVHGASGVGKPAQATTTPSPRVTSAGRRGGRSRRTGTCTCTCTLPSLGATPRAVARFLVVVSFVVSFIIPFVVFVALVALAVVGVIVGGSRVVGVRTTATRGRCCWDNFREPVRDPCGVRARVAGRCTGIPSTGT